MDVRRHKAGILRLHIADQQISRLAIFAGCQCGLIQRLGYLAVALPKARVLLRLLWGDLTVVTLDVQIHDTGGEAINATQIAKLLKVDPALHLRLPFRFREVLNQCLCAQVRVVARVEVQILQLRHVPAKLQVQVEPRLHDRLLDHVRFQVGEIDPDAITIGGRQVLHLRVQILRRCVERNSTVIDQDQTLMEQHLPGLEIQQRILYRFRTGGRVFRLRLIGLAVLVDDQVRMGLIHFEIVQAYARLRTFADRVRDHRVDLQAHKNALCGKVGRLARTFQAVNDQVVHFDREVPKVQRDMAEIHLAAGGVLEHTLHLRADPALKVGGVDVPRKADCKNRNQHDKRKCGPAEKAENVVPSLRRRCRSLPATALFGRGRTRGVVHGASSFGCSTVMLPWARRLCSQSRSRLETCCCCRTLRMRPSTEASVAGFTWAFAYCGSMVFW